MSAGWEMAEGGRGSRLRVHMLRAGVFEAKITEWLGHPDRTPICDSCCVRVRAGGHYLTVFEEPIGDRLEDGKARAEAEIRRLATEALAALGGAS